MASPPSPLRPASTVKTDVLVPAAAAMAEAAAGAADPSPGGRAAADLEPLPARSPSAAYRRKPEQFQCQVEGCPVGRGGVPEQTRFSIRFRLCSDHIVAPTVLLHPGASPQRFCQKARAFRRSAREEGRGVVGGCERRSRPA